jgi:mRNA interferase MazF
MKAKIVLVHFPFTDLSGAKLRPAVVIHENEQDVIVAFISSRVPPALPSSDLLITPEHPAFMATGLKISSVIRFDKIATLSKTLIEGEIGEVIPGLTSECNRIMGNIFRL